MFGPEFNRKRAEEEREKGIRRVAENSQDFLKEARRVARLLLEVRPTIIMDDVRKHCTLDPLHPNAWGAVFKHKDFQWTGQMRQSDIVTRHGGLQRVWRRRQNAD